ncbi:MAG: peptidoglycan-binding protein [Nitrospinota bacterium]|nr:MAG: peptidoglycan-binding protein [Nitrospinota bacterium]
MARAMKEEIGNRAGLTRAQRQEEEIRWLQASLNKLLRTRLVVDGIYGEKTKEAVRKFQRRHGLQVDGIAGPITKGKIRELLAEV